MANLVPTLSYVPFEVARTCEEIPVTSAARAKCEQLTAAIANAVNNVPEEHLLVRSFGQARCLRKVSKGQKNIEIPLTCWF